MEKVLDVHGFSIPLQSHETNPDFFGEGDMGVYVTK